CVVASLLVLKSIVKTFSLPRTSAYTSLPRRSMNYRSASHYAESWPNPQGGHKSKVPRVFFQATHLPHTAETENQFRCHSRHHIVGQCRQVLPWPARPVLFHIACCTSGLDHRVRKVTASGTCQRPLRSDATRVRRRSLCRSPLDVVHGHASFAKNLRTPWHRRREL